MKTGWRECHRMHGAFAANHVFHGRISENMLEEFCSFHRSGWTRARNELTVFGGFGVFSTCHRLSKFGCTWWHHRSHGATNRGAGGKRGSVCYLAVQSLELMNFTQELATGSWNEDLSSPGSWRVAFWTSALRMSLEGIIGSGSHGSLGE